MKSRLAVAAVLALAACSQPESLPRLVVSYPETAKGDAVDEYFGNQVADPYRWLEDDASDETADWVKRQNEVTFNYLSTIPYRNSLKDRLTKLWDFEKYSAPTKHGEWNYYFKNDGLQNQSVLYRERDGAQPEVFLDPNSFSTDGTTSLAGIEFSSDGSLVAYQLSEGGSDWRKVVVVNAASKEVLEDTLVDVKFSGLSWRHNEGFYYSSYDKPAEGTALSGMTQVHKLFFHRLGTAQAEDVLVFGGDKMPRRYVGGWVSDDQRFLFITAAESTSGNELYFMDLSKPENTLVTVVNNFENDHTPITTDGESIYIQTNLDAPNGRLVVTTAADATTGNWVDVIPHTEQVLNTSAAGGKLFANYLKDATSLVKQFSMEGVFEKEIELPAVGTASGFGGKRDDAVIYYNFTNYVYPPTIFSYDIATGKSAVYKQAQVDFNPTRFESTQVFYTSKDGTKVPMIITHLKGLNLDGTNPTLLYGYGGFNISLTPSFGVSNIVFMENGGVLAVANLRGGGEYGEAWHVAGTKMQKQNVFDDFIAAGEWLIAEKYTSSERLAVAGGSNGGLLVGAVLTQRPDLMKVALPAVGVLDMLRYHKFTAGAGWAFDYGTADESEEMFNYLKGYSPVHNCKPGTAYPATMITTADHDDRVVPAHSFKFAAALQAAQAGDNPVLIRVDVKAGHGAGKPTSMIIDEQADKWAFVFWNMGYDALPSAEKSH